MAPRDGTQLILFLRNVASTSKIISQAMADLNPTPTIYMPPTCTFESPTLPSPPNILPELEATGAPTSLILRESEKFERGCQILRRQAEAALAKLTQVTQNLGEPTPGTSTRSVRFLENAYFKRVHDLKTLTLRVCNAATKKSFKVPFNQESTPLLEKYFKENAYPSTIDRAMLAQKTHMTLRQIEVWFQNHRARAKRDGIPLQRCLYDANPDDYNLEPFEPRTPRSTPPRRSRSISNSSSEGIDEVSSPGDSLDRTAPITSIFQWISQTPIEVVRASPPSHAFPTPFSPKSDDDPFPFQPHYSEFEWYRKAPCHTKSTLKRKVIDMDAFTSDFQARLKVYGGPGNTLKRKRSNPIDSSAPPRKKLALPYRAPRQDQARNHFLSPTGSEDTLLSPDRARPYKRRLTQVSKRSSFPTLTPSSLRSVSRSSDCSSPTSSSPPLDPIYPGLLTASFSRRFFSQRLSWHTSKFVQWSSIPALTLNCLPLKLPFSPQL